VRSESESERRKYLALVVDSSLKLLYRNDQPHAGSPFDH